MDQRLALTALVVRDYDEAIRFYVDMLGFELVEDTDLPEEHKRWVVVAPPCWRHAPRTSGICRNGPSMPKRHQHSKSAH